MATSEVRVLRSANREVVILHPQTATFESSAVIVQALRVHDIEDVFTRRDALGEVWDERFVLLVARRKEGTDVTRPCRSPARRDESLEVSSTT
jgi:MinD-like ATPase involved in chromosome partitioning or flagellar assembly